MKATSLTEPQEELHNRTPTPYLSYSRINRYLTCPEQYRLYYVERLRARIDNASMVFGTVIHVAIADLFRTGEDPVEHFRRDWQNLKNVQLHYKKRESWDDFHTKGGKLLQKFLEEEAPKIRETRGVERKFELRVTVLDSPFIGSIDLTAMVNDRKTVVDFKTAGSDYDDHEAALSDQLTAYALAEPEAEQVALYVLVKTKEPRIEWHFAGRSADALAEYLTKVRLVSDDIAAGKFYKRPGKHCGYCDFLPVCLGDEKKAKETLVRIT
jgi:CRISPR/Cas system-associated exonuclease Cas4 (RecB family)